MRTKTAWVSEESTFRTYNQQKCRQTSDANHLTNGTTQLHLRDRQSHVIYSSSITLELSNKAAPDAVQSTNSVSSHRLEQGFPPSAQETDGYPTADTQSVYERRFLPLMGGLSVHRAAAVGTECPLSAPSIRGQEVGGRGGVRWSLDRPQGPRLSCSVLNRDNQSYTGRLPPQVARKNSLPRPSKIDPGPYWATNPSTPGGTGRTAATADGQLPGTRRRRRRWRRF